MNGKNMIIVSSRQDFDDADRISKNGYAVKEINLANDTVSGTLSMQDLWAALHGKTALLLVHGYNNEQPQVHDAYSSILKRVNTLTPHLYDVVIGYSWPGGDQFLDWWRAKSRANHVALLFHSLLEEAGRHTAALDVMSHSLGARVCLGALKKSANQGLVRNYFCTAPAVDYESLEHDKEFHNALSSCGRLFVLHSVRDGVLRLLYQRIEQETPLGVHGPEDKDYISRKAHNVYVANCKNIVGSHGDYKDADKMYEYIGACHASRPPKFKTL
ncbi:MAG: DUF726 domain-containing protein [Candidatus Electronema sp. V4]|uniref:DUF726 domain-containing protein n=1 Tax=Candidatus Electronema sp. V4 TaxID=3454756 RepID=UPI0040555659